MSGRSLCAATAIAFSICSIASGQLDAWYFNQRTYVRAKAATYNWSAYDAQTSAGQLVSSVPWITLKLVGTSFFINSTRVDYQATFEANTAATSRSGTITVGTTTMDVTQLGVGQTVLGQVETGQLPEGTFQTWNNTFLPDSIVYFSDDPMVQAVSDAQWVEATVNPYSVSYNVYPNYTATPRTAHIRIGNTTFTVYQTAQNAPLAFVPVRPCRLVDTRFKLPLGAPGANLIDPQTGSCNLPVNARAYSLNITAVPITTLGYLSIFPAGPTPLVSTLNSSDGRIVANAAMVGAGKNGTFFVFASDKTNLVVDVNGYFTDQETGALFYPTVPCRIVDTRMPAGLFSGQALSAAVTRTFDVVASPCGLTASAQAYSLNFTVVPRRPLGYLSAWPAGETQPLVSTLNSPKGEILANAAIVPAGTNGAINAFATDDTDLVIDANGYFSSTGTSGLHFYPVPSCRPVDTRGQSGQTGALGTPALKAGISRTFPLANSPCGVPADAEAVAANVTVVPKGPLGFLTLWPNGQAMPLASTLNSPTGRVVSNAAIVPVGPSASVNVFATDDTEVVIDVSGYFKR